MRLAWMVCLIALVGSVSADVYKWKDDGGRVHFGDKPPANATSESLRMPSFSGSTDVSHEVSGEVRTVTMYSTSWCGVCKQARAWFTKNGIAFTEIDIEKQPAGRAEFKRLGGRGVPLIVVGSERMSGFSAARLENMLKPSPSGK